jgi:membrane fusion protein, macrolide-specific efflux system
MSRRTAVVVATVLIVVAVGIAVWATLFRSHSGAVRTATVERRATLSATVQATGKVDVASRLSVPLTQAGMVRLIAVKVGDSVHAGDVLAALDDSRQRQDLQAASDALDAAQ